MEGANTIIKKIVGVAPSIGLPLLAARVTIKKRLGHCVRNNGSQMAAIRCDILNEASHSFGLARERMNNKDPPQLVYPRLYVFYNVFVVGCWGVALVNMLVNYIL